MANALRRSQFNYNAIAFTAHGMLLIQCLWFGWTFALIALLIGLVIYNLTAGLYMHRVVVHQHFSFSLGWHRLFCRLFSMCNFGSLAMNCSIHLRHHRYSDLPGDPHSYEQLGLRRLLLKQWNRSSLPQSRQLLRFLSNPCIKHQHRNHMAYGIVTALLLPSISVSAYWLINLLFVVAHWGPSHHSSEGRATDWPALLPLMWGDEMHYRHHKSPARKRLRRFDLLYIIGRAIEWQSWMGHPPQPIIDLDPYPARLQAPVRSLNQNVASL